MRVFRGIARLFGELLVTLGVVLLLYAGWQLWWTDVVAVADSRGAVALLERGFVGPEASRPEPAVPGEAFAVVRVPRFGPDFARPVYAGTTREVLMRGVGHYLGTAAPGEVGNFALAGHRTTWGKPFSQIDRLREGDAVVVETATGFSVYRVTASRIVSPDEVSVLLPVPGSPGAEPTTAMLTMTSCHPEFSSRERFVVHARLDREYTRADGLPEEVLEVSG